MELQSLIILPITIAAFLALLMIIVFVHEYGHFSMARLLGVRVDIFSIGFGKPILQWVDRKGTQWRIAALPLGGYVKFFGDLNAISQASPDVAAKTSGPATTQFPRPGDADEIAHGMTAKERAVCFHFKPVWARAAIVAAGPIANFILAIAIFAALFAAFGRPYSEPVVGSVLTPSAAQEAGVLPGDRILAVNGRSIQKFRQIQDAVLLSSGDPMGVLVLRSGAEVELTIVPTRAEKEDRYGNPIEVWQLGIGGDPNAYGFEKYGFFGAIREGVNELWRVLSVTTRFLGKIIAGKEDAKQLGGPIKMAQYAGQSAMSGFDQAGNNQNPGFGTMLKASLVDFISLAAFVSVSIGFLNILPVPVLDGGHLLYYAYEAIAGRPLGARAQAVGFRVGIVLLASLMFFVTWNDINNLISSIS